MPTIRPLSRILATVTATAAVVLTATGTAVAVPASGTAPARSQASAVARSSAPDPTALHPVVELSAERLATADLVAAAKWGTDSPIDDPAREQQVLDSVAAQAVQLGADPDEVRAIFRDQIEANKLVQRALFQRWTDHPEQAPTTRPDLSVIRKEINRINTALVQAIAGTAAEREAPVCLPELVLSAVQVHRDKGLDHLHTKALARSLRSVCGS
ncbi:chorismate mutase [Streptomyces puniciscabiei]|uniref:chorismate mutase n=1 Tax=Streptomyces puniciscabiei TaxID=164348 RepID=A0A542UAR7_9ACTN|nr:chorismate mutase [Streptomyces puniciscabiei]TQK96176.1 chorismate mutase [Streptomyces puniciscabiei]